MNLKRLEAYGFKSFADKMVLNFKSGVTCIVGPNGCGKSNVSEAIRWVLGEQAPKNLRAKKMQEIIFNGTTNRRPLGYCECSLVFDNADRTCPVDADDLVVTRKLYRNGDSEYFVNKEQVRLKEIINLFRDTGVGKDGYSVVGQGKVDAFLSARPEDRRQVFEEAAGISKFRAKRAESQKKLDKTYDNLLRVKDKMDVYESRMGPLKKQSEEAVKARELKSRLKILDVNHYLYVNEHNSEQKAALEKEIVAQRNAMAALTAEREKLEAETSSLSESLHKADEQYTRLYEEKVSLTVEISQRNFENKAKLKDLDAAKENIVRLGEEIKNKNQDVAAGDRRIGEIQKQRAEYAEKLAEYREKIKEAEVGLAVLEKEVERRNNEVEVTREMQLTTADEWGRINGDLSQLKAEIVLLEKAVNKYAENLDAKKKELKTICQRRSEVDDRLSALKKDYAEKSDIKKDIDSRYGEKLAILEDSQDKLSALRDSISRNTVRIEQLEEIKSNYSGFDSAVRFLMSRKDPRISEKILAVVGNAVSVPAKFAPAIEVALGGGVNNIITADLQDTSYLIDCLNFNRGGRGTFLPLTAMRPRPFEDKYAGALDAEGCFGLAVDLIKYDRRFRPAMETLLGRVVVVDTKETAIALIRKYPNAFRIVTLDGTHYAVSGAVSGGRKEGRDSRLLSAEADLAEVRRNLAADKGIFDALSKDVEELKKTMREAEAASKVLDGILGKLNSDAAAEERNKSFLEQEKARVEGEAEKLAESVADGKRELAVKRDLYAREGEKINATSGDRVNAADLLSRLLESARTAEFDRKAADDARTEILFKIKELEGKLNDLDRETASTQTNIKNYRNEILNAGSIIKIEESKRDRLISELEKIAENTRDNSELIEIEDRIKAIEDKRETYNGRQEFLRRETGKKSDEYAKGSARLAKAETLLERVENEVTASAEKVRDEYGLDPEEARGYKDETYDDASGVSESKNLRRKIADMGEINEKAVEDLEALNKEYTELKLHYEDVLEAKTSIEETIKDLTVKMEENFSAGFEAIKENFSAVFAELFGGGRGVLKLEIGPGESVLDAGIIIAAEPPGKKLQNLDLLSGGEKALTAIALLFSVIKLHPMPFCVLDEVDATLDDANAAVYAKYLKKFSGGTQFIIVSHRKPTMEYADELYGITMQEMGVSKFFAVKLSEALKISK